MHVNWKYFQRSFAQPTYHKTKEKAYILDHPLEKISIFSKASQAALYFNVVALNSFIMLKHNMKHLVVVIWLCILL